jgi:hypothetical protein
LLTTLPPSVDLVLHSNPKLTLSVHSPSLSMQRSAPTNFKCSPSLASLLNLT